MPRPSMQGPRQRRRARRAKLATAFRNASSSAPSSASRTVSNVKVENVVYAPMSAGADHGAGGIAEAVVEPESGEQPEDEATGGVHGERPPGKCAAGVVLNPPVEQVPGGCADGRSHEEHDPCCCRHDGVLRPTYLTTSTSSSDDESFGDELVELGRNSAMAAGRSMMTMAMGRSSDSDRMRVVWMWLDAP